MSRPRNIAWRSVAEGAIAQAGDLLAGHALTTEPGNDQQALNALADARKLAERVAHATHALAMHALEQGATYSEVGSALGITRQAAHLRFRDRTLF